MINLDSVKRPCYNVANAVIAGSSTMTTYTATISHHSISRARTITIVGSLARAKRAATIEFGGDQQDYKIAIHADGQVVATRMLGDTRWTDWSY